MKTPPPSVFLITFQCGAWRARLTLSAALEVAKHEGVTCCSLATLQRPHAATVTEYTRVAEAQSAKRRPISELDRLLAIPSREKLKTSKPKKRKGGLVVIDGGRAK